jgi:hypothetical protein
MDPEIRPLLADVRRVSGFILDDPRVRDPAAIHDLLRGYRGPEWLPKDPRGRKRLRKAIAIWTARWRSSWEPPLDLVRFDESDARLTPIMLIPDFIAGFYGFFAYSIRWFGTGKGPRSNMSDQFELVEELLGVRRLNLASSLGDRIGVPTTLARR